MSKKIQPFSFVQNYVFLLEDAVSPDERFFFELELVTLDNDGNVQYKVNIVKGESVENYKKHVTLCVVTSKELDLYCLPEFRVKLPQEVIDLISNPARCIAAYKLIRGC